MRNPYITGRWVSGREHYGRQTLLAHILKSPEHALWVVGNRRMGKTSLLRQLELVADVDSAYVPLFWDMQGSQRMQDLAAELIYAIEEQEERFQTVAVDVDKLRDLDAIQILRSLHRLSRASDKGLLLLCDEAEALLQVAHHEPGAIAGLRKVLQSDRGLRVIMTSTKVLSRINDLDLGQNTSPFLFGFGLRNLAALSVPATLSLMRKDQDDQPIEVDEEQARQIMQLTGNHPYLTQVLCSRLFETSGRLRTVQDEDLTLDSTLRGYFENDFRFLSPGERQVLLSVGMGNRSVEAVAADTGLSALVAQEFAYSLVRLGQLRQAPYGLMPANEFLRRWLQPIITRQLREGKAGPDPQPGHVTEGQGSRITQDTAISDRATLQLIAQGQQQETRYVFEQLRLQRANLRELEHQRQQFGLRVPLDLINEINQVKIELENLEQRLALISPEVAAERSDDQQ